jgi:hypothetical protein
MNIFRIIIGGILFGLVAWLSPEPMKWALLGVVLISLAIKMEYLDER